MTQIIIESATSENLKYLLRSAIENELKIIKAGINRTERVLDEFEKRFGIETICFYEQYQKGKLGDDPDYLRWAGEYETLQRLKQDYNELGDIEFC